MSRLDAVNAVLVSHAATVALLRDEARRRVKAREHARSQVELNKAAHGLLVGLSESCRAVLSERVEAVVTLALRAVFGTSYRFSFAVEVQRNAVQLRSRVSNDGGKTYYGVDDLGGGVIDVVGFALRVVLLSWHRPKLRQVLVADEPFRHVSDSYLPAVAAMVQTLSKTTGIQFIIVSHEPVIAERADRVYEVRRTAPARSEATVRGQGSLL